MFIVQIMFLFLLTVILSVVFIYVASVLALIHNIADHPGGHKRHDSVTPFVGGVGVLIALSIAIIILIMDHPEYLWKWLSLAAGSIIIFVTGFADDIKQLNYKLRFLIQSIVALVMILGGGVVLYDLGGLLGGNSLELGVFAIPFTIFATIGGINALNMIDGIDGLSGSVSLVVLLLISLITYSAGDLPNFTLALALAGGICGFLFFNLRYFSQRRARVFLGDNGSMLLGFLFAWMLADLTQASSPVMTPVTAIWLFAIPLMDTVSVMLRRVLKGKSPFEPDHNHLHHILISTGFRVEYAVTVIVALQLLLGTIGIAGLNSGVPEYIMLWSFLFIFAGYFYITLHPWYFITALRYFYSTLRFSFEENYGVFLGSYTAKEAESLVRMICQEFGSNVDYWVRVVKRMPLQYNNEERYAVAVHIRCEHDNLHTERALNPYLFSLMQRLSKQSGIQMRQFVERSSKNERRTQKITNLIVERRSMDRRNSGSKLFVFEAMFDKSGSNDSALQS